MPIDQLTSMAVTTVSSLVQRYAPEPVANFASALTGSNSSQVDISPEYRNLIEQQIETQAELQQVSLYSNLERSQHETRMAAVRNIRLS